MRLFYFIYVLSFLLYTPSLNGYWIPFDPLSRRELHPESLPLCKNCVSAREHGHGKNLVCNLFGKVDPVHGKVWYDSCSNSRANESHCGTQGRYYHHVYSSMES